MEPKVRIPVRIVPREQMLKQKQEEMREFERRYEMSSEEMVDLFERDEIRPTAEVLRWYQVYHAVQYILEMTPTTGTPGTTTAQSMRPA